MSASEAFFSSLLSFGQELEGSVQSIQHKVRNGHRTQEQFLPTTGSRVNLLDMQVNRMRKCILSQQSVEKKTNLSLQYILSICQIILDENEILLDDIEEQTKTQTSFSREKLYDDAMQNYRENQEQEMKQTLEIDLKEQEIRESLSRLSSSNLLQLPSIHSTPIKQQTTQPSTNRTPSIHDLGLSASSLQAIGPTDAHNANAKSRPPSTTQSDSIRSSLGTVPNTQLRTQMKYVEQSELNTLPSYLTHQLPSLDALNECIATIRVMGVHITQAELKSRMSRYTEDKYLRAFLLVLLKLGRFTSTARDTQTNELVYQ